MIINRRQLLKDAERDIVSAYLLMRGRDRDVHGYGLPFLTYQLVDPRNGDIFYVGSGTKARHGQHITEARHGLQSVKCDRIRAIWAAGGDFEFRIVGMFRERRKASVWENLVARELGEPSLKMGKRIVVAEPPC